MEVLVTGATGILGHHVADILESRGHHVTRASRSSPVRFDALDPDTFHVAGGKDAIVHCATDLMKAKRVEVDALTGLRKAAPDARIVYPSIVGVDRIPFSYYKVKVAAEHALVDAGGDHAILRITQFHEFADRIAAMALPVTPKGMRVQSIAAEEAAAALVEVVESTAQGLIGEVGGPEVHDLKEQVKQRLRQQGRRRPIVGLPLATKAFREGHNLCPEHRVGKVTWADHLARTA